MDLVENIATMEISDDEDLFSSSVSNQALLPKTEESRNRADSEGDGAAGWSRLGGNRWYYGKKYQRAIHMTFILNVILFILVIILFVLHHQSKDHQTPVNATPMLPHKPEQGMSKSNLPDGGNLRIPILPTISITNGSGNSTEPATSNPPNHLISFILQMAGWERAGNIYYKKFTDRVTYSEAQNRCRANGGNLAAKALRIPEVIRSMESEGYLTEGKYVTDQRLRNSFGQPLIWSWIGFNDLDVESEWRWYDGGKTDWNLAQWSPGEPNNWGGNQNCGQVYRISNGKMILDDDWCSMARNYICEIELFR